MTEALLTTNELAARWKLLSKTLRDWRVKGKGPRFIRISKTAIRYAVADVEAFEKSRRKRSTAE